MRQMWIVVLALLGAAVGCSHTMDVPKHFVSVDRSDLGPFVERAISADGVVIALRRQDNPSNGTLEFWSEALRNEMVNTQGYQFVKSEDVKSSTSQDGKLMEFAVEQRGTPLTYMMAVYVMRGDVVIVESGGKADEVKKHMTELRKSMLSAR